MRKRSAKLGQNLIHLHTPHWRIMNTIFDRWNCTNSQMLIAQTRGHRWIGHHLVHIGWADKPITRWVHWYPTPRFKL